MAKLRAIEVSVDDGFGNMAGGVCEEIPKAGITQK